MSSPTVLHLLQSTTLSSVSQKPDLLLTTNLDFKSILALSFSLPSSVEQWCIAYHVWVCGGVRRSTHTSSRWGICLTWISVFPISHQFNGKIGRKLRSSNPKCLWLTSDKLWFCLKGFYCQAAKVRAYGISRQPKDVPIPVCPQTWMWAGQYMSYFLSWSLHKGEHESLNGWEAC